MSEKNSKSQKFKNLTKFIEDFSLFIKNVIVLLEKILKVKIEKFQGRKTEE